MKRGEGLDQLALPAPVGVVVELDVGDRRDLGAKLEEAAVALVGLGDDPVAVPQPAFVGLAAGPAPGSSPPSRKAGSAPAARSAWASMPEVVVLPCAPATAISRFSAQSSASSSPRWRTRWSRSRAPDQLRVVLGDRGRDDDVGVRRDRVGVVADPRLDAGRPQALECRTTRRGRSP